jgi:Ca2+-binding RTX toxin-like protein
VINLGTGTDALTLANGTNSAAVSNTETITGGTGADVITLGAAQASGTIDLGAGTDTLTLANGGNTLTVSNVETINGGTGADIITLGAAQMSGTISLSSGADSVTLSSAGNNSLTFVSTRTIIGGSQDDNITLGSTFTGTTTINGGAGTDTVTFFAANHTVTLTNLSNVETINIQAGFDYSLTLVDGNVAAGQQMTINAASLGINDTLTVNGAAELDGKLVLTGGSGNDNLTGGSGNDLLRGNSGSDTLTGGAGDDTIAADSLDSANGGANTAAANALLTAGAAHGDLLVFDATIDLTNVALNTRFQNFETVSIANADSGASGNQTLSLNINDVLDLSGSGATTAAPGGAGYSAQQAVRIEADSTDTVNLVNTGGSDHWLTATGATGVPAGYTLFVHVTSGASPTVNEDGYVLVSGDGSNVTHA